jgi:colanic acid/amylovoran biosynthesis glycosyltransferase
MTTSPPIGGGPRIAYLVKRYPRFSETFIVNEILAHEAAGAELDVFALNPSNDTHFQDAISRVRAPVTILPSKGLKATALWEELSEASGKLPGLHAAMCDAWAEDVVHVHQASILARALLARGIGHVHAHFGSSPATVARLAARFAGLSYSFTAHAKDLYHESVDRGALLARHGDRATVVTVSDFNRRFLIDDCGFDPSRVARVYNGLELDRFPFREPDGLSRRIVAIGRLVEKKGFCDLIEACAELERRRIEFECLVIGEGPLRATLATRIEGLHLGHRVRLLGPRPQEETGRWLASAAAFAAPCIVAEDGDRDGVPTTLLEALALGVPCVSTDVTGIPEVIVDGATGLVVPQRDPKALADALVRLLEGPALGLELARRGRALVDERFDAAKNTGALRALFAQASSGRNASPYGRRGVA